MQIKLETAVVLGQISGVMLRKYLLPILIPTDKNLRMFHNVRKHPNNNSQLYNPNLYFFAKRLAINFLKLSNQITTLSI